MNFFDLLPSANLHDLNLDWIIKTVMGIEENQRAVEDLTADIDAAKEAAERAEAAAGQIESVAEIAAAADAEIKQHEANMSNPHQTTAEQVGAILDRVGAVPLDRLAKQDAGRAGDVLTVGDDGVLILATPAAGGVSSVNGQTGDVEVTPESIGALPDVGIDATPIEGSENLVTSGGVFAAIGGSGGGSVSSVNGQIGTVVLSAEDVGALDRVDIDAAPVRDSSHLVTSGGVYSAISQSVSGVSDVKIGSNSIVTGGVATIPTASNTVAGVIRTASAADVASRAAARALLTNMIDTAVKAAMCDGAGAAWSAEEQTAAQQRIGILSVEGVRF